jgi:hypothetical protein
LNWTPNYTNREAFLNVSPSLFRHGWPELCEMNQICTFRGSTYTSFRFWRLLARPNRHPERQQRNQSSLQGISQILCRTRKVKKRWVFVHILPLCLLPYFSFLYLARKVRSR